MQVSIPAHKLLVIMADGCYIDPVEVDVLDILPGVYILFVFIIATNVSNHCVCLASGLAWYLFLIKVCKV